MITAILPVWTGAEYIEETIESIKAQTFADWEMLILGEPDGSEILKDISLRFAAEDNRIRWIENEAHLGLAATLNKGIELARGKYIARVDVDDPCYPHRFEKQIAYFTRCSEVDILGAQSRNVYPIVCKITEYPTTPEEIRAEMLFRCCICHSSLMFSRELFANKLAYPTDMPQEDYALWLSLLDKVTFANLDEPLLDRYVERITNISHGKENEIACSANKLSAFSLEKYFGLDTRKYSENRFFNIYVHPLECVGANELGAYISNSVHMFFDMEAANGQYKVFNNAALSKTLKKYYNRILNDCFIGNISIPYNLPLLPEKTDRRFADDIITAFKAGNFRFDETFGTDELMSAVRDRIGIYINYLKSIFDGRPRVVIFGAGYFYRKFIEERMKPDNLFEIVSFCDNDMSKIGTFIQGKPVVASDSLRQLEYDYILIATREYYKEIHAQLADIGVSREKIMPLDVFRLSDAY
jgi:glycosyltransferase involved in cell wall biosynthesis